MSTLLWFLSNRKEYFSMIFGNSWDSLQHQAIFFCLIIPEALGIVGTEVCCLVVLCLLQSYVFEWSLIPELSRIKFCHFNFCKIELYCLQLWSRANVYPWFSYLQFIRIG